MKGNTSCWYCSIVYPINLSNCPSCGKGNANDDLKKALNELYPLIGDEDDSPYCECGNDPMEDELASNQCDSCGKAFS